MNGADDVAGPWNTDGVPVPSSRVALVTGSSRGLGLHIATRLAADGITVAVNGTSRERTDAAAAAIQDSGGTAHAFVADVTDEDAVGELVAAIRAELGPIDTV